MAKSDSHTTRTRYRIHSSPDSQVLLGVGIDPAVHVYLLRVSDMQGTMIVMCPALKWNNFLAEQGLHQGGHVLLTLHRLMRSWKDLDFVFEEPFVRKYQGVGGLLRGMIAKDTADSKSEVMVSIRLTRSDHRGNIPNFRVMVVTGRLVFLGKGPNSERGHGAKMAKDLPFYRGDEACSVDGKFVEKVKSHRHITLVHIFDKSDTVQNIISNMDTHSVVDLLVVCKGMTASFWTLAGGTVPFKADGEVGALFPLHDGIYRILHSHLIAQCMGTSVDRRVPFAGSGGCVYEEGIGFRFFESLKMPNGEKMIHPPSPPLAGLASERARRRGQRGGGGGERWRERGQHRCLRNGRAA